MDADSGAELPGTGSITELSSLGQLGDLSDAAVRAHYDLGEKSRVVLRLGRTLLACGAGAYRVKSAMARAAKAVGLTRHESKVALMDIIATAWQGSNFRTEVAEIRAVGVDVAKLDRLMRLCAQLHQNMTAEELDAELDRIDAADSRYPAWLTILISAIACSAFTFLNDGGPVECATVLIAAGIGQWLRMMMGRRQVTHFAIWSICAAISTLIYVAIVVSCHNVGLIDGLHHAGIMSSFLYLIPGFPLTTAILDFTRMDFSSSLTRFSYCIMVIASAGVSVWIISHLFAWPVHGASPIPIEPGLLLVLQFFATLVAAYGFAVLFNAPWRVAATAALIGSFVNVGRFALQNHGMPWQMSVGLAAFVAGILAMAIAKHTNYSRVSLSVPAVVIMIPGVPFYRAILALNEGNYISALGPASEVFFVVLSIGMGLAFSRILTDPGWFFNADTTVLKADLERTKTAANI